MLDRRNITLVASNLVFAGIAAALFFFPGWETAIFPAFGLIVFMNDLRKEGEIHVIFVFLAMAMAVLLTTRTHDVGANIGLCIEVLGLLLLSGGISFHRNRLAAERTKILRQLDSLETKILDNDRELRFYNAFEGSAVAQIRLRRDMTQAAKSLGTTMDAQEVQLRLMRILEGRYKGSTVRLLPGMPHDPIVKWAARTKTPVLVKDMYMEDRFGPRSQDGDFRSAIVVPMDVDRKPYGYLYMTKPEPGSYDSEDLKTVDLFATITSLTLDNIKLYDEVHNLAMHDPLTQLFTQRAFRLRLKEEVLRAGRGQMPLSVIMSDIDHFKSYNDNYGHQAGDEVLRSVSRILVNHVRAVDTAARYGGEEFALILPNAVHDQALALAERIRVAVSSEPFVFQGRRTQVTMSFGVSTFPGDATAESQLLRSADERLYVSKESGRNRVTG